MPNDCHKAAPNNVLALLAKIRAQKDAGAKEKRKPGRPPKSAGDKDAVARAMCGSKKEMEQQRTCDLRKAKAAAKQKEGKQMKEDAKVQMPSPNALSVP